MLNGKIMLKGVIDGTINKQKIEKIN